MKDTLIIPFSQEGFGQPFGWGHLKWYCAGIPHLWRGDIQYAALIEEGHITQWAEVKRVEGIWNPDEILLSLAASPTDLEPPVKVDQSVPKKPIMTTYTALLSARTYDDLL